MENLFFSDPWFPSRRSHYHRATPQPTPSPKSKVISIPVTDGSKTTISRNPDRPSAAVKIQKAVRGFLVRKTMRNLRKFAAEAEEIGRQISPEKVRSNAKERLRIGEMLMALLLRLDTVRGVRDYRKKVIRRVIQLQEALDSITQTASPLIDTTQRGEKEAIQQEDGMTEDVKNVSDDTLVASAEFEEEARQMIDEPGKDNEEILGMEMEQECDEIPETMDNMMEGELQKTELNSADEMTGMKEMMEKTAVENETLKRLVRELCERSAQQCELMSGLVQRVKQLELRLQGMGRRKKRDKAKYRKKLYAM